MLTVAYIGFGNSVVRYHLPYVTKRDYIRVKSIYRREEDRIGDTEREAYYPTVHFTTDINEIMNDAEINLIVINTPPDSHVYYAKMALEHNKNVLVEKPFAGTPEEAKEVMVLAKAKGLIAMPNHNRRYDGDFLTVKKVIESGVLGDIVEIESHYDYFKSTMIHNRTGMLHNLAVHTIDQMVALCGVPDRLHYDVRGILAPGISDDYIDIDFHYENYKGVVKTCFAVKLDYPRFIVHGKKGSFIKPCGVHQSALKSVPGPVEISFEVEPEEVWGQLSYIDDEGNEQNEKVQTEIGDYGLLYDKLYESIVNGKQKPVTDEETIAVMTILEDALAARR